MNRTRAEEIKHLQEVIRNQAALLKEATDFIESVADDCDDPAGATTFAQNIMNSLA